MAAARACGRKGFRRSTLPRGASSTAPRAAARWSRAPRGVGSGGGHGLLRLERRLVVRAALRGGAVPCRCGLPALFHPSSAPHHARVCADADYQVCIALEPLASTVSVRLCPGSAVDAAAGDWRLCFAATVLVSQPTEGSSATPASAGQATDDARATAAAALQRTPTPTPESKEAVVAALWQPSNTQAVAWVTRRLGLLGSKLAHAPSHVDCSPDGQALRLRFPAISAAAAAAASMDALQPLELHSALLLAPLLFATAEPLRAALYAPSSAATLSFDPAVYRPVRCCGWCGANPRVQYLLLPAQATATVCTVRGSIASEITEVSLAHGDAPDVPYLRLCNVRLRPLTSPVSAVALLRQPGAHCHYAQIGSVVSGLLSVHRQPAQPPVAGAPRLGAIAHAALVFAAAACACSRPNLVVMLDNGAPPPVAELPSFGPLSYRRLDGSVAADDLRAVVVAAGDAAPVPTEQPRALAVWIAPPPDRVAAPSLTEWAHALASGGGMEQLLAVVPAGRADRNAHLSAVRAIQV